MQIEEIAKRLPRAAQHELIDFAEFLLKKYALTDEKSDTDFWNRISEDSLSHIWDNPEDDIYGELL